MNSSELKLSMLLKMLEQQGAASTELKNSLTELYLALRDSSPKLSSDALHAFCKAREVLARYEYYPITFE